MPRIKRWFPVSHDFNRDPQVIELRKEFGDWSALAWLELLSIADRNSGTVPGTVDQIAHVLTPITLAKYQGKATKRVRNLLETVEKLGWIECETGSIQIVNYAKYHRTPEQYRVPSEPDRTRPEPIPKKESRADVPKEPTKKPKELDARIKVWADKIYRIDRARYARLIVWIKAAERSYAVPVIASTLERYLPYAPNVVDWWSYLDRILDKQEGIFNASKTEAENNAFKTGTINPRIADFIKTVK